MESAERKVGKYKIKYLRQRNDENKETWCANKMGSI